MINCDRCNKLVEDYAILPIVIEQLGTIEQRCSWEEQWCPECFNTTKFVCGEALRDTDGIPQIVYDVDYDVEKGRS